MVNESSNQPTTSVIAIPWLGFAAGCFAFLYTVWTAVTEAGDPPYTANDAWQRIAIIACPLLFATAAAFAFGKGRRTAAKVILFTGTLMCLFGWSIVHWDIPTLFQ